MLSTDQTRRTSIAKDAESGRGELTNLSLRDLLLCFEGFGDNCEFGFIQRRLGAEPIGLFRFSWVGLAEVTQALGNRFAALEDPAKTELYLHENNEYFVRFDKDFYYHTFVFKGQEEPEILQRKQFARNKLLRRNLIASLELGEKIIVRKGQTPATIDEIRPLHAVLQTYGPNTLLWVVPATAGHRPGSVEVLDKGLLRGYVGAVGVLAPFVDNTLDDWVEVCVNAYNLWRQEPPPVRPVGVNLIFGPEKCTILPPRGGGGAELEVIAGGTNFGDESQVLRHRLSTAMGGAAFLSSVRGGLDAGRSYVLSALVWLPASFGGRAVAPGFPGQPSAASQYASLGLREQWQRIWATAQVPKDASGLSLSLNLVGDGDDTVYTTRWRLEAGEYPLEYVPRSARPAPPAALVSDDGNLIAMSQALGWEGWKWIVEVVSSRSEAMAPFVAGEPVLRHEARVDVDGIAFDRLLHIGIEPEQPYIVSARVWIPATFRGKSVVPMFVGFSTVEKQVAELAHRDCWQTIWAKAIVPAGKRMCAPALRLAVSSGDVIFTTCWKVERGNVPTRYVPQRRNLLAGPHAYPGEGWQCGVAATAEREAHVRPPVTGAAVLTHRLEQRTHGGTMNVYHGSAYVDAADDCDLVLSIWVIIPSTFRGLMVCPQIGGEPSRALFPALLSTEARGKWQRVWAQATIKPGKSQLAPKLLVIGEAGDILHSSCWKLERSQTPSPYSAFS